MSILIRSWSAVFLALMPLLLLANSEIFEYRAIEDFRTLDQFESVELFEEYIDEYQQDCIANTYAGLLSIDCFVGYEIWDRELNKYYQLLQNLLSDEQSVMLRDAQRSWIQTRDSTINLNNSFIYHRYAENGGTVDRFSGASDWANAITPIVKQRALLLRDWYLELLSEQ